MRRSHWRYNGFIAATILCAATQAQAGLLFDALNSKVTYRHDVIDGLGVDRSQVVPTPTIPAGSTPGIVFADMTLTGTADGVPTLTSRAKAGFGHLETSTRGTGVAATGTLVTQSDPGNMSAEFSELTIEFDLRWTVTAPGMGPPLIGSFSMPVLGVVGTGGLAEAEVIDMHWKRNGVDMRSAGNALLTILPGATLATLNVPGAPMVPSSLSTGNTFTVTGTIAFRVKNDSSPVSFYFDPEYQELVVDDALFQQPQVNDGQRVVFRFDDAPPGAVAPAVAQDSAVLLPFEGAQNGSYGGNMVMAPGLRGSAATFDGVDNFVQGSIGDTTQSFSVELWASSATPLFNADGWLANAPGADGFAIRPIVNTAQWQGIVFDQNGNAVVIGTHNALLDDITQLHHYTLTYDDALGIAAMYFDGQLVGQLVGGIPRLGNEALAFLLGRGAGATDFGFGLIDEFGYYPFALRPEQVLAHSLVGFAPQTDPDSLLRNIGVFVADVPEPASLIMLGMGTLAAGLRPRRREAGAD